MHCFENFNYAYKIKFRSTQMKYLELTKDQKVQFIYFLNHNVQKTTHFVLSKKESKKATEVGNTINEKKLIPPFFNLLSNKC